MRDRHDDEPLDWFHVTSTRNRASIERWGLDWSRMGAAPGIAGSRRPEAEGVFLARGSSEADWFVQMNNTGGPVDVWQVQGVDRRSLRDSGNGHVYLPAVVPPDRITRVREDLPGGW